MFKTLFALKLRAYLGRGSQFLSSPPSSRVTVCDLSSSVSGITATTLTSPASSFPHAGQAQFASIQANLKRIESVAIYPSPLSPWRGSSCTAAVRLHSGPELGLGTWGKCHPRRMRTGWQRRCSLPAARPLCSFAGPPPARRHSFCPRSPVTA